MTAPAGPAVRVVTPTVRARARLARPMAILVVVVLAVLGATMILPRLDEDTRVLSPANAAPDGARALARVLEAHGIDVRTAQGPADALAQASMPGTTLVVVFPQRMAPDVAEALRQVSDRVDVGTEQMAGPLDAESGPAGGLTPDAEGLQPALGTPVDAGADCASSAALRAGQVTRGAYGVRVDGTWRACFVLDAGAGTGTGTGPLYAYAEKQTADAFRAVIPDSRLLRNGAVDEFGNAALAINAIARTPRAVWYLADWDDSMTAVPTPTPGWLIPLLIVLGGAGLFAAAARGRRLGRLVPEDLPSAVPATETVIGRGRLLRRSHGAAHAARALRLATATRLAARLGVPPQASEEQLLAALARAGIDPARAHDALWGPPPTTDQALVDLADALSRLEEDIRHE